jgi:hypothetical protein
MRHGRRRSELRHGGKSHRSPRTFEREAIGEAGRRMRPPFDTSSRAANVMAI